MTALPHHFLLPEHTPDCDDDSDSIILTVLLVIT